MSAFTVLPYAATLCALVAGWLFGRIAPGWQGDAYDDAIEPHTTEYGGTSGGGAGGGCLVGMFASDWRQASLMVLTACGAGWLWWYAAEIQTPFSLWWPTAGIAGGYLIAVLTDRGPRN
jgi:hypothetical protein